MKKLLILICLFIPALLLNAQAPEDFRKAGDKARLSYSFGMLFGSNLRTTPLEFDYHAFTEGFKAMFEGNEPQFTEQEAVEIVEDALHVAMEKVAAENRQREEAFLTANSQRPGVQVTPSGLQYEVILDSGKEKPNPNSVVKVNYAGRFIDGSTFDKSDDGGEYIPLEMVIGGWAEGLLLMSLGSKHIIYIPSSLAYGKEGVQNFIPAYSTLIFEVELLEIHADAEGLF